MVSELPVLDTFANSGRTLGVKLRKSMLGNHQIGQTEERLRLRRVFGQSAIAGVHVFEDILDDVDARPLLEHWL